MHPVYIEFMKAFTLLVANSQNLSMPDSRKASTAFYTHNVKKEPVNRIINSNIPGPDDNIIPIRVYIPEAKKSLPVMMYFHGGGWAFGSIEDADGLCRQLANLCDCIVVSVEYRLSPEHQFPKGLNDCYAATEWVSNHAKDFGGDSARLAVAGDSAGGNLAAAVAMMVRDKADFPLKMQLLICPALTNDLDAKVFAEAEDQSFITFDVMKMFWNLYLEREEDGNNPYASPLKAKNFGDLAPAFIITAECDALRAEGEAYTQKLKEFNSPVRCKRYPGAIHCFISLPIEVLPERKEALKDIKKILSEIL